jgi:hypothetical protein
MHSDAKKFDRNAPRNVGKMMQKYPSIAAKTRSCYFESACGSVWQLKGASITNYSGREVSAAELLLDTGADAEMISDTEIAAEVKQLVLEAHNRMEQSMKLVEQKCPTEEFAKYKRAVGKVVSAMLFEIIEPLYEQNPKLKPEGWDE